jgi:tRNA(Ile)-lysidine synthase
MANSRNSPPSDRLLAGLTACLTQWVSVGESLLIAYSGGLDSTVLLHAIKQVAPGLQIRISAMHVNHGISPHAKAWADHCTHTCAEWEIPLQTCQISLGQSSGEGLEALARKARREALLQHAADWIAMAHHANDQAETLLHNLLRGAGPRGAAGIPERRGRVLRPWLQVPRSVLLEYAQVQHLSWIEDESNSDCRYTRNYLRHNVIPVLAQRFPRVIEQLAASARRFGEAQDLLDQLAILDLQDAHLTFPVAIQRLRELSPLRAKNAVRTLISTQQVQLPDEPRLDEFIRQLQTAASDRHPSLETRTYRLFVKTKMLHFARRGIDE